LGIKGDFHYLPFISGRILVTCIDWGAWVISPSVWFLEELVKMLDVNMNCVVEAPWSPRGPRRVQKNP
jgi:hypothetical protein